ncbi:MAG: LysE family translocator [Bacteroides sp.]|nr:LysE family translocator [Bacteroides sp.]
MLYSIWHTIAEAFLAGMTLSFMFGPAFFTILQTSLERGFKAAFWIACGIFVCDSLLVLISFLGASRLFTDPSASKVIGVVGGAVLVLMGIYTFRKKVVIKSNIDPSEKLKQSSPGMYFLKGFFMNMANPGTWIFWFVTVGAITAQYTTDDGHVIGFRVFVFFLVTLCTIFSMDVLKSFVANKIKKVVNERTIKVVNKVVGVVLVLFGAYLLLSSFVPLNIDSVTGALRLN